MIVGVDEVGRGCLVGNVVAAAVVLPTGFYLSKLTDSKKLSVNQRQQFFKIINQECKWAIGEASPQEIDTINILNATMLAMRRAVKNLNVEYDKVLVDGDRCPNLINCQAIIKGDLTEPCISAASIVAKVWRDKQMLELGEKYPVYGFEQHKGYGTKQHLAMLQKHGIIAEHRKSFAPIIKWIMTT